MKPELDMIARLFLLSHGEGYTTLGFAVCFEWTAALAKELKKVAPSPIEKWLGKEEDYYQSLYDYYEELKELAEEKNKKSGWRSKTQLTPQLIGLEGKVVRVVDKHDDERVFIVGKSTGFIPVHLEIEADGELGGSAVYGAPFKSVKVVRD